MGIFGGRRPGQARYSGELHNLSVTESVYGTVVPIVVGTTRVHGKLLWYGGFKAVQAPNTGGKGIFGGKSQVYDYYADVVVLLAQGPCVALLNVWDQQGKLENLSSTYTYTIGSGGTSVSPVQTGQPPIQQDLGVTASKNYSVNANDYGGPGPVTLTGTQQVPFKAVSGSPGQGEYSFNPSTSTYSFNAADSGTTVAISYSSVFSLYYFEATQAANIPTQSPWTVSTDNQQYFYRDNGVTFVDTGEPLTRVDYPPTASGEYQELVGFYTFAQADAGRYVYIKYSYTSSDPDLTNSSSLNLTFVNGAQGQAAWGFLESNFPAEAYGYSALCYVGAAPMAMGESPTLPSYNYELMGLAIAPGQIDADVTVAIGILLTNPLCGVSFPAQNLDGWSLAQAYWGANGFFISASLDTQSSVSATIQQWLGAGNVAAVWSEGLLKLIPYGDTTAVGNGYTYTPPTQPVATLTWDNLLPFSDSKTGQNTTDDPLQVARVMPQDAYNYVQAEWTNRENDYNNELTPEQNDAFIQLYGLRMENPQSWHFITTQTAATWALNLRLKRLLYLRNTYKFNLGWKFAYVEPMDILVLPTGESVRVTEINETAAGKMSITAEQFAYGSADVTIYAKQTSNSYQPLTSQALPGPAIPVFVQNTVTLANGLLNKLQIAASGQTANWGGCNVYVSIDGNNYGLAGVISSSGIIGQLTAPLPVNGDPDTTDTLSVDISLSKEAAELVSVTQAEADNFTTLCAIIDPESSNLPASSLGELVSYETATLTAENRYNLAYLRRGIYGSPINAHSPGAWFAFLGLNDLFDYQYYPQYVGQPLYVKLQSFNLVGNQLEDLSQCHVWELFVSSNGSSAEGPTAQLPTTYTSSGTGQYSFDNPTDAYDGKFNTQAGVIASNGQPNPSALTAIFRGWSGVTTAPLTLYVTFVFTLVGGPNTDSFATIEAIIGFTESVLWSSQSIGAISKGTVTMSIPVGTDLSTLSLRVAASNGVTSGITEVDVYEIWIE